MMAPRPMTMRATLALFVFVCLAFALVSYRTQVNAGSICRQANTTASFHNQLVDQLEESVRIAATLTEAEKADRLDRYESVKVASIRC